MGRVATACVSGKDDGGQQASESLGEDARCFDTIDKCGANALHWAHRALELDGRARGYTADEWLPTVFDITGHLLETARVDREPPSLVDGDVDGG